VSTHGRVEREEACTAGGRREAGGLPTLTSHHATTQTKKRRAFVVFAAESVAVARLRALGRDVRHSEEGDEKDKLHVWFEG